MMRPYELLIRFAKNGTISGASVRYLEQVNGRDYELDPVALADVADDPAFVEFATAFNAAAAQEVAELRTVVEELRPKAEERDELLPRMEERERQFVAMEAEQRELLRRLAQLDNTQNEKLRG